MGRLRNFINLSLLEKLYFFRSGYLIIFIHILFVFAPYRRVHRYITKKKLSNVNYGDRKKTFYKRLIIDSINRASRYIPFSTCLSRALTGLYLLKKYGIESKLQFGVLKDTDKKVQAHAWLENEDRVIIGNLPGLKDYIKLPALTRKFN